MESKVFNKITKWGNIAIMPLSAIMIVSLLFAGNGLAAFTWSLIGITSYFNYLSFKMMDERE